MAIPKLRTEDGSSYCSNCHSQVDSLAVDCLKCGLSFEENRNATRCPSCGAANLLGAISCLKCGKLLRATSVEEPRPRPKVATGGTQPRHQEPIPSPRKEVEAGGGSGDAKQGIEEAKRRTQALWELSEPFEKVIRSRRRRLAKINYMLEGAKEKLAQLEKGNGAEDEAEREKLKSQIQEIMNEKEEIINIEEGIAEMERIYRNLLALQESELHKKQDALQARLETFEKKMEEWNKEKNGFKSKEQQLMDKEGDVRRRIVEIEGKERGLQEREKQLKEKMRILRQEELEMMKMKFTGDSSSLSSQKGWREGKGGIGAEVVETVEGGGGGLTKEEEELNNRISELEVELKRVVEEREKLQEVNRILTEDKTNVKRILKVLDCLLERLPDEEIRKFASSEDFKLYEKVLERLEM